MQMLSERSKFQSTLPRRERPLWLHPLKLLRLFQSTLPRRERLVWHSFQPVSENFNPHSHEGSDVVCCTHSKTAHISIHTPTKGATRIRGRPVTTSIISIHTPTKGATESSSNAFGHDRHFNPHSHEGSDGVNGIHNC